MRSMGETRLVAEGETTMPARREMTGGVLVVRGNVLAQARHVDFLAGGGEVTGGTSDDRLGG